MLTRTSQCNAIHKTIVEQFKHAIVYGQSVKHQPQRVGLTHELADEDISKSRPMPASVGRMKGASDLNQLPSSRDEQMPKGALL